MKLIGKALDLMEVSLVVTLLIGFAANYWYPFLDKSISGSVLFNSFIIFFYVIIFAQTARRYYTKIRIKHWEPAVQIARRWEEPVSRRQIFRVYILPILVGDFIFSIILTAVIAVVFYVLFSLT